MKAQPGLPKPPSPPEPLMARMQRDLAAWELAKAVIAKARGL